MAIDTPSSPPSTGGPPKRAETFGVREKWPLKHVEQVTPVPDNLRTHPDARNTLARLMSALRNARKESKDGLTGMEGRKKFNAELESAIQSFREGSEDKSSTENNGRGQNPPGVTVAVIDLNFLKLFNDGTEYGFNHGVGDSVIKYVADQLKKHFKRSTDIIAARCGGDEFGIVMRNVPRDQAKAYLEKVSEIIRSEAQAQCKKSDGSDLLFDGKPAPVSVSFGCYEIGQDDLASEPDNKKLAEKAWAGASIAEAAHKIEVKKTIRRAHPEFVAAAEDARYKPIAGIR